MTFRFEERKDLLGGLLMLAVGLTTVWQASAYPQGTLRRMGPGFFPLGLGVILAAIGGMIVLTAKRGDAAPAVAEWRGWVCICGGIAAFAVLGRFGGLMPATFAVVFIAALGDRENSVAVAAALAAVMTAVCVAVFWWLLQVPLPLLQWG